MPNPCHYQAYYSYPGSLSRPPCTEAATYILLKHSLPIADEDLDAIKALQVSLERHRVQGTGYRGTSLVRKRPPPRTTIGP